MFKYIDIFGLKTRFTDENDGNAVLFLHGWGSNLASFAPVCNFLQGRMVLLDLWGFGGSCFPQGGWGVEDYAKAVIRFADLLGLKQFSVVGHSFGGRIAITLAANYPDRISKVVLVSAAGLRRKSLSRWIKVRLYKTGRRLYEKGFLKESWLKNQGSRDYKALLPEMKATFLKIINTDLSECAKKIICPTLLLWGRKDKETPMWMMHRYRRLIKDSRIAVIKGVGHFGHEEKPYGYAVEIKRFLEK